MSEEEEELGRGPLRNLGGCADAIRDLNFRNRTSGKGSKKCGTGQETELGLIACSLITPLTRFLVLAFFYDFERPYLGCRFLSFKRAH